MTLKFSVGVRNAEMDAIETAVGSSAVLKIFAGSVPTNITDSDTGTVLATLNLPADWMNSASSGSKTMSGVWSANASGSGIATYFRIYATGGSTQHIQGTTSLVGDGGDLILDNTNIQSGQTISVTEFTIISGNA